MNILDALKQLRDDIKAWVTNNLNAVNAKIDQKTVQIDNELNDTSTNPVQNKVIAAEVEKINSSLITKEYVDEQIANIKPSDDLATKEYVDEQIANIKPSDDLATKEYVDEQIANVDIGEEIENRIASLEEQLDETLEGTLISFEEIVLATYDNGDEGEY